MRDLSNDAIDAAAVLTVCAGSDRQVGLLTKRDADTLGGVTPATKLKAEAILDAVEAHFGARPQTVWGAGSMPEHNSLRCLDVMITTLAGGWLGGSKDRATEIGDWVAALVWANRGPWGLRHILWRRRIISTTTSPGVWRALPDRGSITANHEDHPHLSFLSDAFTPLPQEDDMTPTESAQLARIEATVVDLHDRQIGLVHGAVVGLAAQVSALAAVAGTPGGLTAAEVAAAAERGARRVLDQLAART